MISYPYLGRALTHQIIVPGDTATGISKYCYEYWQFKLLFIDGDAEIKVGDWLIGATSAAKAKVKEVHADTTSWTNNTGYLILDSWNGTAYQNAEELKVAANATIANASGVLKPWQGYMHKGDLAKAALVSVITNTALICFDGSTPDQTALIGQPMVAGSSIVITEENNIRNFKAIDYASGSASTVQVTLFF